MREKGKRRKKKGRRDPSYSKYFGKKRKGEWRKAAISTFLSMLPSDPSGWVEKKGEGEGEGIAGALLVRPSGLAPDGARPSGRGLKKRKGKEKKGERKREGRDAGSRLIFERGGERGSRARGPSSISAVRKSGGEGQKKKKGKSPVRPGRA